MLSALREAVAAIGNVTCLSIEDERRKKEGAKGWGSGVVAEGCGNGPEQLMSDGFSECFIRQSDNLTGQETSRASMGIYVALLGFCDLDSKSRLEGIVVKVRFVHNEGRLSQYEWSSDVYPSTERDRRR